MTETSASPGPEQEDLAGLYERYRLLRERAPVSQDPGGSWQVARYEDVRQVLKQDDVFSSDVVPPAAAPRLRARRAQLPGLDVISLSIDDTSQLNGFGAPTALPVEIRAAA